MNTRLLILTLALACSGLSAAQPQTAAPAVTVSGPIDLGTAAGLDTKLTITLPAKTDLNVVLGTLARAGGLTLLTRDLPVIPVSINAKGLTVRAALTQVLSLYADRVTGRMIGSTLVVAPAEVMRLLFPQGDRATVRDVMPGVLDNMEAERLSQLTGARILNIRNLIVISGTAAQVRDARTLLEAVPELQPRDTGPLDDPAGPDTAVTGPAPADSKPLLSFKGDAPLGGLDPALTTKTLETLHGVTVTTAYGRAYIQAPTQAVLDDALGTLRTLQADMNAQPSATGSAAVQKRTLTTTLGTELFSRVVSGIGGTLKVTPLDAGTYLASGTAADLDDLQAAVTAAQARELGRFSVTYTDLPDAVADSIRAAVPTVTVRLLPGGIEVRGTPQELLRVSTYLTTLRRELPGTSQEAHTDVRLPLARATATTVLAQLTALYGTAPSAGPGPSTPAASPAAATSTPGAPAPAAPQAAAVPASTGTPATGATSATIGGVRVVADDTSRALILSGPASMIQRMTRTVHDLDVSIANVRMALRIDQVSNSNGQDLGINWSAGFGGLSIGHTNGTLQAGFNPADMATAVPNLQVQLDAARRSGRANTLLDTTFIAQDGRTNVFSNGGTMLIPVTNTTTNNGTTTTTTTRETYEYGLKVTLTPSLAPDGRIEMQVQVDLGQAPKAGVQNSIVVEKQSLNSVVTLRPGEGVLLGGIISTGDTATKSGVPILSEIPVIGALFSKSTTDKTTGLLLFTLVAADNDDQRAPAQPAVIRNPDGSVTRYTLPGK